jgi:hypothetical protein
MLHAEIRPELWWGEFVLVFLLLLALVLASLMLLA